MSGGVYNGSFLPPQFSQKYELVGQYLLKSRATSCLEFVSLIFLILSFQNAGNGNKMFYFSKFPEGHSPVPRRGSRAFCAIWADSCPPPLPKKEISKQVRLCPLVDLSVNICLVRHLILINVQII